MHHHTAFEGGGGISSIPPPLHEEGPQCQLNWSNPPSRENWTKSWDKGLWG